MSQVIKNKGRILTTLLLALIVAFAGIALAGRSVRADESGDGWTLSDDGTLTITSETAFQNKTWNADDVKKVVIADGVNKIGMTAFSNHTNLTSVDLGSCETIGYAAFSGCTNLTSITPTSQVTSIDKFAFKNCASLQSIDLPNISSVPEEAFRECSSLESIDVSSAESFDQMAFYQCRVLETVITGSSLKTIGKQTFAMCDALSSIDLSSVESIGNNAFYSCDLLGRINLSSIKTLDNAAFSASGVTEVILSDEITEISAWAFDNCKSLTSINLENVATIKKYAFNRCRSLSSVDLRHAAVIEYGAFEESGLTSLTLGYRLREYSDDSFPFENITSLYLFAPKRIYDFADFSWFPNATVTYGGAYDVTFMLSDSENLVIVEEGLKVIRPDVDPTRDGYTFTGWYEDVDCTVAFDFETPITEDTTIFAGWKKISGVVGFTGYSISLDGDIGVNFYCVLPEGATDTDYIEFSVDGISGTQTVTVKNARAVTSEGVTEHVFKCHVPAKNMTSAIHAKLFIGGEVFAETIYTVKEYAEYILNHPTEYGTVVPLVRAMLNYGAYAQIYFDYYTDYLATDYIDNTGYSLDDTDFERLYDSSTTNLPTGLTLQSASLILESNTDMKIFFKDETGKKLHFFLIVDNKETELTPVASGDLIYVRVTGIPAKKLDENFMIGIVAEGDETRYCFYYSPMMYAYNVVSRELTVTRSEELKNLMKAFYLYSEEALKYWGTK